MVEEWQSGGSGSNRVRWADNNYEGQGRTARLDGNGRNWRYMFDHRARQNSAASKDMLRTKRIRSGSWQTVEWYFNATGFAFFRAPAGTSIKVRYGVGAFGKDRQKKTLNGREYNRLIVTAGFSLARARMQVRVPQTTDVTYDVYLGDPNIIVTPEQEF
jgi:hypothetical protein